MSLTTADFLVGPVIGHGSFGRVLYCKHKTTDREVAIKVFDKVSLRKRHALHQAVLQEQRLLRNQLKNSKFVVDLWASFHDQECLYLVMECIKGGTLGQLIQARHSRDDWLPQAAYYGLQILMALQEIHSNNVIHCDLSPTNILVSERGHVKLCDFGSAMEWSMLTAKSNDNSREEDTAQSGDDTPRGTCDYCSPEVVRSQQDLNMAVDIWSFGCILFCLVQGQSPFTASSEALAVQKILAHANEPNEEVRHKQLFGDAPLSSAWERLVAPMLEPDATIRMGPQPSDWHAKFMTHSVWFGVDIDQDPMVLPPTPDWLSSLQDDDFVDGQEGWSVFLT